MKKLSIIAMLFIAGFSLQAQEQETGVGKTFVNEVVDEIGGVITEIKEAPEYEGYLYSIEAPSYMDRQLFILKVTVVARSYNNVEMARAFERKGDRDEAVYLIDGGEVVSIISWKESTNQVIVGNFYGQL